MKKVYTLIILLTSLLHARAQVRGFGNIDTADLRSTASQLEKDANAEVLFDRARLNFSMMGYIVLEQHRRVKIFNEKGKEYGNIKIEYDNMYGVDHIANIEAQTINLEHGKIVVSKVDPKQFYFQHTDQNKDALVFSFPNVKPGSVVEYRYTLERNMASNFPAWYFQSDIPTRYSEFDVYSSPKLSFQVLSRTNQAFEKDTSIASGHTWVATNLPSSKKEAYMRSGSESLQSISLLISTVKNDFGHDIELINTWDKLGRVLANEKDYYKELDQHLSGEDTLLKHAVILKCNDEKIAYLFNTVKTTIGWNGYKNWASRDGIRNAWKKRVGNSAEVNAALYHLLKKSGIKAYPLLVSTRENGSMRPDFVDKFQINDLVVYVPVDSAHYYILDATDKYNTYNQIPFELLNSYGLCLNKDENKYDMIYIENKTPAREIIMVTADISNDAKMKGTGAIASYTYNRSGELEIYKTLGDEKFKEYLAGNDNNIKISNLKLENMGIDTLPLTQNFDFTYDLNNSDNYIYFTPNIFTPMHTNPFLSEVRFAPVDFGHGDDRVIVGKYKIPAGYDVESLPKNANMIMPDKSIRFKRVLEKQDGYIMLHYEIDIKRTLFLKSEYSDLHEFFRRMYDMLDEQIILKKT